MKALSAAALPVARAVAVPLVLCTSLPARAATPADMPENS